MKRIGFAVSVICLILLSTVPFLWPLVTSIKSEAEISTAPPTLLPRQLSVSAYQEIFEQRPFARYILNSFIVALGSTALAIAAGSAAAYALSRMRPARAGAIEAIFLLAGLFPPAVLLVPLFTAARVLQAVDSYWGLILAHAAFNLPLAVWSLASFFRGLPRDLEDAARIDGFSRLQFYRRILLPLSAPAVAAAAIIVFIFSWNEFVIALTFMQRDAMRTVPVGIAMLSGTSAYEVPWGQVSAAIVLTTLPVVIAVLALQRRILGGLTAGAVKG